MFSVLPYFTWFMLLVTTLALIGEIRETTDDGKTGRTSEYHTYLFWIDLIFVVFTLAELIIKVRLHRWMWVLEDERIRVPDLY